VVSIALRKEVGGWPLPEWLSLWFSSFGWLEKFDFKQV